MNLMFFGKIFGAIVVLGTASTVVSAYAMKSNLVTFYMVSENVISNLETQELIIENSDNFMCKINGNNLIKPFECKVYEWKDDIADDKNHYSFDSIDSYFTKTPTKNSLKTNNKFFKVEFDRKYKLEDKNSKIEIIAKVPTNTSDKYGILEQWINNYEDITEVKYFIGKANSSVAEFASNVNLNATTNTTKCEFENIENALNSHKSCRVWDFSSTEDAELNENSSYSKLIFNTIVSISENTKKYKYYLVRFDENIKIDKSKQQTLTLEKYDDSSKKTTFVNIKPVLVVGQKLFVL